MFDYLSDVGRSLRGELVSTYWVLIVPVVLLLIVMEFLKNDEPDVKDIFRRVLVSVILLYSFDTTLNAIATIGDSITDKIDGLQKLWDVLKNLGPNYNSASNDWFNLRETALYIFNIGAYIIAYLGFFISNAMIHFVWTILFVCSPLMILAYVARQTEHVTFSLYKGLVQVVLWKILWSLLGVLLLKLAMNPKVTGMEDYLMSIIINLSIGLSMLFIPIATRSLVNDGMESAASAITAVPTMATGVALKAQMAKLAKGLASGAVSGGKFAAKPITNPFFGRAELLKQRLNPKLNQMKKTYENLFLPKDQKKGRNDKRR
ncbi:MAG: hypothetical protein JNL11_00300 [Bdellovibrionaceae bacterium]|nr:hypothetical protein [Pseudobdellovibrionaceae bacterium]